MSVPLDVSIFLNNALKAKHLTAELESDTPLPDAIREMPDSVSGQFVELDESGAAEIASAWKQTMILRRVGLQRHGALRRPDARLGRTLNHGFVALLLSHFREVGVSQRRPIMRVRIVRSGDGVRGKLLERRPVLPVARGFELRRRARCQRSHHAENHAVSHN